MTVTVDAAAMSKTSAAQNRVTSSSPVGALQKCGQIFRSDVAALLGTPVEVV